jgi:hypothetical protein
MAGVQPASAARNLRIKKTDTSQPIKDSDLAMRPVSTRGYNESWIVWAWNKQGYNIYALFVATRMVFGIKLGVQLTIRTPDGKIEHKMVEYSEGKYKYKKKVLDILVPKKHRIRFQKNRGFVTINFKKWGIRLNFKRLIGGYRLQGGPICQRSRCFDGITFAPHISVKGNLRVGGKNLPFTGTGYADHSWQDMMPHHLANRWFGARAVNQTYTLNTSHLKVAKKWNPRNLPALFIAKKGKWIFRGDHKNLRCVMRMRKKDKRSGYNIPQRVIYRGTYKGIKAKVDIKNLEEYDNFDILSQFNRVLRFILQKFITKPFLFRYKAQIKVTLTYPDGKKEKTKMVGYSEMVFLNK